MRHRVVVIPEIMHFEQGDPFHLHESQFEIFSSEVITRLAVKRRISITVCLI